MIADRGKAVDDLLLCASDLSEEVVLWTLDEFEAQDVVELALIRGFSSSWRVDSFEERAQALQAILEAQRRSATEDVAPISYIRRCVDRDDLDAIALRTRWVFLEVLDVPEEAQSRPSRQRPRLFA